MNNSLTLAPQNTHSEVANEKTDTALTTSSPRLIYSNLKQSVALAAGIEALALQAAEHGEPSEQDMEFIADLSTKLKQDLTKLSVTVNETITGK